MNRFLLALAIMLASVGIAHPAGQKVSPIEVKTCTSGQFVSQIDSAGAVTCGAPSGGSGGLGDVVGPGSATDGNVVLYDGTTGKLVKNSSIVGSNVLVSGGALGTPASGDASNLTNIPAAGSNGNLQTNNSGVLGAYAGTSCTNQFPRSLNASGAATCATVANADLANSSITLNAGASTGLTAPGAMTLGSTYTIGATSDQPRFAGLGLGGAATGANQLAIFGGTSGRIVIAVPAAAGTNTITLPAGTTDFSSTGGTSQFVKQASTGASLTVVRPACADLSDSASGCSTASPTVKSMAPIGWVPTSNPNNAIVFTANSALTITAIKARIIVAVGATAAISVIKAGSGTDCTVASGVNLIASAATIDANTASTTNQSVTLAGSGAPSVSANDTVCLQTTNGANFAAGLGAGGITIEYTVP